MTKVRFHDDHPEDLPGGNAVTYEVDCSPQTAPGRQYFVACFIPAWQILELEWYVNEKAEPQRFRYPIVRVKRFT